MMHGINNIGHTVEKLYFSANRGSEYHMKLLTTGAIKSSARVHS